MTAIPEELSPDQLRAEATRRELRDRAKWVADRRAARNKVVDAILAIDPAAVQLSRAPEALTAALKELMRNDTADQEREPTNGEIGLAGHHGWWDAVRTQVPHVSPHPLLEDMRRGRRNPSWC